MIAARLEKLAAMRARFGWWQTSRVAMLWLLRQSIRYREAVIFRLDVDRVNAPAACKSWTWEYKRLMDIDPDVLAEAGIDGGDLELFARGGERCFAGSWNGQVCYISIVSTSGFSVPERVSIQFTPGSADAYVGNCFTVEQYRGKGVYPCALLQLGCALRAEGRQRLYLFVERENLASIRSVEKVGFQSVAVCRVFQWRGRVKQSWRMLDRNAGSAGTPIRFLPFKAAAPTP
jgi:RimJ/RimL family protein N-acetyltransferase